MCFSTFAQSVRPPAQSERDQATAAIAGADPAAQTAAVAKLNGWIKGGWVSADLWRKWLPDLVKAGRHQDVADLALAGLLVRNGPEGITPLMDFRVKALLALNKPDEALQAAKSYYNVCDLKYTKNAVDTLALALARARPDDLEIVRSFRNQQAAASTNSGQSSVASGQSPDSPLPTDHRPLTNDNAPPALTTDHSLLTTVQIDPKPYEDALQRASFKTKFTDRVGYANLLLAADKGTDAEKVFKECFQLAATQEELTTATEGIAKALRAQDGNVARANAWLISIQNHNATQPANLPPAPAPAAPPPKDPALP